MAKAAAKSGNAADERAEKAIQQKLKKLSEQKKTLKEKLKGIKIEKAKKGKKLDSKVEKQNAKAQKEREKLLAKINENELRTKDLISGTSEVLDTVLNKTFYCATLEPCLRKVWLEAKKFWVDNLLVETNIPMYHIPFELPLTTRGTGSKELTVVHVAALTHDVDWLKEILEEDDGNIDSLILPTVGSKDKPLHLAALMCNKDYDPTSYSKTIEFLVSKIKTIVELTSPNFALETPLILACRAGNLKACKAICKKLKQEHINATASNGETAFLAAAKAGSTKICELLIEKGAAVDVLCEDEEGGGGGQNALHIATRSASRGRMTFEAYKSLFELLVMNGLDVNEPTVDYQQTLLHIAAYEQAVDPIAVYLFQNFLSNEVYDVFGKQPFNYISRLDKGMFQDMYLFHSSYVNY